MSWHPHVAPVPRRDGPPPAGRPAAGPKIIMIWPSADGTCWEYGFADVPPDPAAIPGGFWDYALYDAAGCLVATAILDIAETPPRRATPAYGEGLEWCGARCYDRRPGRWLSADPLLP